MSLFKISRGNSSDLSNQPLQDGHTWFTPDDGRLYIDSTVEGSLTRVPVGSSGGDSVIFEDDTASFVEGTITIVVANPTLSGSEPNLVGLLVGGNKYQVVSKKYVDDLVGNVESLLEDLL